MSLYLGWQRETHDVDFALASDVPVSKLVEEYGFKTDGERLYTPGGLKADVYTRDVNGVPVDDLFREAVEFEVGGETALAPRLEQLLVTKITGRPGDVQDLMRLLRRYGREVDWRYLRERYGWAVPELERLFRLAVGGRGELERA